MGNFIKSSLAGVAGGFVGNGILGVVFSLPILCNLLYDPHLQSKTFIDVTANRDIPLSVAGLVLLSAIHGFLFLLFKQSIPGSTNLKKGLFWGLVIWLFFWLPQEWFIYHTLLGEPLILNTVELIVLLIGAMGEGLVISGILRRSSLDR